MALAFKAYYVWVLLIRMRGEINAMKVRTIRMRQVHQANEAATREAK